MARYHKVALTMLVSALVVSVAVLSYTEKPAQEIALVKIDQKYEKRTVVKKSRIPNAGNGLFAAVSIKKDEVIGELGGLFVSDDNYPTDGSYVASIPECAWEKTLPYKYIDSKEFGGNVSRINFAPSEINGIETNFQNATIKQTCEYPYVVFVALRDIKPGEEIWSSYGEHYDYDRFMTAPEIRNFFCSLAKIDCRGKFEYSH